MSDKRNIITVDLITHFILLGGASHVFFFKNSVEVMKRGVWSWTVPRSAKKGDIGLVYLCAPESRIVGQIEFSEDPYYNMEGRWAKNWMAPIGDVKYFEPRDELKIAGLRKLFPDWAWLRYPRGKCRIPAEILPPLLELLHGNKN